jgi:hypothetical protein
MLLLLLLLLPLLIQFHKPNKTMRRYRRVRK